MWKNGHSFHGLTGPLEATHERSGTGQPRKRGHRFLGQGDKELACPWDTSLGINGCHSPEMALQGLSGTAVASCDTGFQFPQATQGLFCPVDSTHGIGGHSTLVCISMACLTCVRTPMEKGASPSQAWIPRCCLVLLRSVTLEGDDHSFPILAPQVLSGSADSTSKNRSQIP